MERLYRAKRRATWIPEVPTAIDGRSVVLRQGLPTQHHSRRVRRSGEIGFARSGEHHHFGDLEKDHAAMNAAANVPSEKESNQTG
jgi:hypothetical protein